MPGLLGDRYGVPDDMTGKTGMGRCEEVVRSARCCVTLLGVADRLAKC